MKKIILMISLILMLTGCYNYRELTDLAIVSGVSISMVDGQYEIVAEVVNPKRQQDATGSDEPDFIIYKQTDSSLQLALRKIIKESPKKLYAAHLNVLIIDESVAFKHLDDILDFFARDPEVRNEFYVFIGKSKDILSVTTPLENVSSENILDSLKVNHQHLGYSNLVTYHDLLHYYLNPYQEIALPCIKIVGSQEKAESTDNLKETERYASSVISGIAIFRSHQLVGYLEDEDALVYNLVTGNTKNYLVKTNYPNGDYMINEVLRGKSGFTIDAKKNKVTISIKGDAALDESTLSVNYEKNHTIESLQDDLNETIEDMVYDSVVRIIQKYHTDIYGFQDAFYKKKPSYIKNLNSDWNQDVLDTLQIKVQSNIKIIEKGNLNGGLYDE